MLTASLRFGSLIALVAWGFVGCGSDSRDNGSASSTGGASAATSKPGSGGADATTATQVKSGTASGGVSMTSQSRTGGKSDSGGNANSSSSEATQSGGTSSSASQSKGSSGAQGGTVTASSSKSSSGGQGGSSAASSSKTGAQGGNAPLCTGFGAATKVGTMQSERADDTILKQISGIVASREQANVLYALTDSDRAEIYVVDETGKALGTLGLNITPDDWEGLSMGLVADGPDLIYVADIGDNSSNRTSILINRFEEPSQSELTPTGVLSITEIESAKLVYPSGAKNAEAMFVDPKTQDILIATKDQGTATVYRAPASAFGSASTTLEEVGKISMNSQISAGDISPSGDLVIFRTYDSMLLFPRLGTWKDTFSATAITIPSPAKSEDPQSEGVTFTSDGTAWLSAGEQVLTIYQGVQSCK